MVLATDPELGERALVPGFDLGFTDRPSDEMGEPPFEPSELDDFDRVLLVEESAVRAASYCINNKRFCSFIAG